MHDIIGFLVFLWLLFIYGIVRFFQIAQPYREDSEEQRQEDLAQERWLSQKPKR